MMDTQAYEFATGIPTHDAALQMLECFPKPNQIGERIGFLQHIGFSENRAREVEHHYWPATRGEVVLPIAPPRAMSPPQQPPHPSLPDRLSGLLKGLF